MNLVLMANVDIVFFSLIAAAIVIGIIVYFVSIQIGRVKNEAEREAFRKRQEENKVKQESLVGESQKKK